MSLRDNIYIKPFVSKTDQIVGYVDFEEVKEELTLKVFYWEDYILTVTI
jgi:hypothetical protein